ncbi:MAG: FtsL-like putative cell division protein [Fulvivirga sp.]|nr:FtsL-like putative cell division protein [Fulvivirga sp.]
MATNTYKIKDKSNKQSIFTRLEQVLKVDAVFENGLPVKYLPYILFITCIGLFYIGNSHYAESTIRKIDKLKREVEDLRADYTTLKADYMYASKQSEVAKKIANKGIKESLQPPEKIIVREGEY